ncbi:hypothetical protein ROD_40811 [Citrobacter rodentium ICC168]|uniref:Uncharacterized protein n=1 Tax=Citrobacter rodentium (strain ICC168) TaxID=637910 RepID=D2TI09_CITRI|nr:hypothetical protein ROD_40811 [Citrobacter rodentium ICC168]
MIMKLISHVVFVIECIFVQTSNGGKYNVSHFLLFICYFATCSKNKLPATINKTHLF